MQKNGEPIHVREMADHHLLYTIRLLRRWGKRVAAHYNDQNHPWDNEEAESMYWFEGHEFTQNHPTWAALQFERRMRGLSELADDIAGQNAQHRK